MTRGAVLDPPRTVSTRTTATPRKRDRKRWGLTIIGVVVALVFLMPYLIMLSGAFKSRQEIL
jgi:multiple sugar transport system permease protein